ncbi:RlpA-like double-psi beta-barrel domain-containing protein [Sporobolomyces koalae]|uniref:RlpA-like double-psi beta-barrel domain-containing protein n=1 Tax=Sporobolomyces koalae TaxID=500713 RepID=UPI003176DAF9
MRSLATVVASLLIASTPSLAFSLPAEDTSSIFARSNISSASTPTPGYHFDERSGVLTEFNTLLSATSLKKRDTFTVSVGLMLERDVANDPRANKFEKRRHGDIQKRARDSSREMFDVEFSKRGELVLPGPILEKRAKDKNSNRKKKKKQKKHHSSSPAKNSRKAKSPKMQQVSRRNNHSKSKGGNNLQSSSTNGIQRSLVKLASSIPKISAAITWYTGADLLRPYCADKSGWTPKDSSLIAAVTLDWGKGRPACGSFLQLKSPKNNKSVIVRLVDMCGGCAPGIPHVDLSKAAFQQLFALEVGKVTDIEVSTLAGPPFSSWTSKLKALYGPQVL